MIERCPSCKKPVPPGAKVCPYCPMSFEKDEELERVRWMSIPPSVKLAAAIVVLLVGSWYAWNLLSFVLRYGSENLNSGPATNLSSIGAPRNQSSYPWEGIHSKMIYLKNQNTYEGGDSGDAVTMITPQGQPLERSGWIFHGTIYDLKTLSPLSNVEITFKNPRLVKALTIRTDKNGRYEVRIPVVKAGGYQVEIRKKGYSQSYLDPQIDNVSEMSAAHRAELSRQLAGSLTGPYPIEGFGAHPIKRDFYLAPENNASSGN